MTVYMPEIYPVKIRGKGAALLIAPLVATDYILHIAIQIGGSRQKLSRPAA